VFVDLAQHLQELKQTKSIALPRIEKVVAVQPKLRAFRDHMGVVRFCTSDVNAVVDTVEMTHRTDDDGAALEVLPFVVTEGLHVYSDPPIMVIGFRNPGGFGEIPLNGWKEILEDNNISLDVIRKVNWYFKKHAPVDYSQVAESVEVKF